jgi:hypothetical protein
VTDELEGHDPFCPVGGLLRREGCPDCHAIEQATQRERSRIRDGVMQIDSVEWALNPYPAVMAVVEDEETPDVWS